MQKKEIVLTLELLVRMDASEKLLEFFKERYPNSSATLSEVLSDLQELANTDTECPDYEKYVDHAIWLILYSPPTQEPLVLNELNRKVIIHNGDVTINCDIDGGYIIIGNGKLNIKGNVNLTGYAYIWAKENIDAKNIKADGHARIWVNEIIKAINIAAYGYAGILANKTIDAKNITADGDAKISALEITTQNIMDDGERIHGEINIIHPSSNQPNTNTAS